LSGLVLTSSFDWSVKLWSPNDNKEPLSTFENFDDYIYDVQWNPSNPSVFVTANNDGSMDLFDLSVEMEQSIENVRLSTNGQNRCRWDGSGGMVVSGDSEGNVNLLSLCERKRRMENVRLEDF
jgi:dynein intermediate chain